MEGEEGVWGGATTEIRIQDLNAGCLTSDFMHGFQPCHVVGTQGMMSSLRLVVNTREYGLTVP